MQAKVGGVLAVLLVNKSDVIQHYSVADLQPQNLGSKNGCEVAKQLLRPIQRRAVFLNH